MSSETEKNPDDESWPGKPQDSAENPSDSESPDLNDTKKFHWHLTDFGPGAGPDISSSDRESAGPPPRPEHLKKRKKRDTDDGESCSIVHEAEDILEYKVGDQCPNCDFASLKLDPDEHVSCPICRFGAYRACG